MDLKNNIRYKDGMFDKRNEAKLFGPQKPREAYFFFK